MWLASLLCAATIFSGAGAAGQESATADLRMRLVAARTSPATAAPPQLMLYGRAPLRCAPVIEHVALDGTDLSIELKAPQSGCDAKRQHPFSLQVDPQASTGLPILPGQTYRVRVYQSDGGAPSLVAFQLFDTRAPGSAPTPENGFWWSEASAEAGPAARGNGASIEWQDGQLAVGLFGFSDTGAATWYFGSAQPEGRVARVALVQLANGDPLFASTGSQPVAEAGPRLEIEFLSPTRARAWLVQTEAGRDVAVRPLALSRSRFATGAISANWSGQWVLVPDDAGTPRLFEFTAPGNQDAAGFHLEDTDSNARLDCRVPAGGTLPDLCTLSSATLLLADFDLIGFDHLGGRDADGARIRLVRVPR